MDPREIALALRSRGFQAFFAGGCVRDPLLGRAPKDFDIATNARPDVILALFPGAQLVGAKFGVVLVPSAGPSVEVATFRRDGLYADGRHPESVVFSESAEEDAQRRDFTINGLFRDPETDAVIDFVGGRRDLERRRIRAIGDPHRRFEEDHLRMLRAVRFAARFDFEIDDATFAAIRDLRSHIHRIAAERVRDEIVLILTEGRARRGFELLDATGLLREILPEVCALQGVQQPPEYHPEGDVWTHTMMMLEGLENPTPELALGVLFHDIGKPSTFRIDGRIRFDGHVEAGIAIARGILARLRFSSAQAAQVEALIANHMRFIHIDKMRESTLKRFFRLSRFEEHLELHRLDCLSSNRKLGGYQLARERFAAMPPEVRQPPRLLTGAGLIAAGYRPGPEFSAMLEAAETAQLDGAVHTPEEALALVRSRFGR